MVDIIPAVMPKNAEDLEMHLARVTGLVPLIQIDIMDGHFVSDLTWPYTEDAGYMDQILHEDSGLPYWDEFDYEVDLMIANPEREIDQWITAGARRIIVHQESTNNLRKIIEEFRLRFPKKETPDIFDVEFYLAQNIDTPTESLYEYLDLIDGVQFMGIQKIGEQGNPFDKRVIEKIRQLRQEYPGTIISVDGGVNLQNAPDLIDAGASRLVVGSAIFKSEHIPDTIEEFRMLT